MSATISHRLFCPRYKDGMDKMGFHKDDEKELCRETPIASLTLGAERDFVFKHEDKAAKIVDEKLLLQDGLLLLMHAPTNRFWYHAIPQRKACKIPRINLTFRQIKQQWTKEVLSPPLQRELPQSISRVEALDSGTKWRIRKYISSQNYLKLQDFGRMRKCSLQPRTWFVQCTPVPLLYYFLWWENCMLKLLLFLSVFGVGPDIRSVTSLQHFNATITLV